MLASMVGRQKNLGFRWSKNAEIKLETILYVNFRVFHQDFLTKRQNNYFYCAMKDMLNRKTFNILNFLNFRFGICMSL